MVILVPLLIHAKGLLNSFFDLPVLARFDETGSGSWYGSVMVRLGRWGAEIAIAGLGGVVHKVLDELDSNEDSRVGGIQTS